MKGVLAGASGWWFAKAGLSSALIVWCAWQLLAGSQGWTAAGQVVVLIGAGIHLRHFAILKRATGSLGAPSALVTARGLFSRLRHPMYLGDIMWTGGLVMMTGEASAAIMWVGFGLITCLLAQREDAMMAARFPEQFPQWKARTGLLLPRARLRRCAGESWKQE